MTPPRPNLSWIPFIVICGMALFISCSDNGSSSQPATIEISRITPDSGAVGSEVTIHSPAIDPEHARNQVELGGIDVPILSYGSGSLTFRVPEGAASGPVTLSVNGKVASGPYFKVLTEGPLIEAISPASGGPGTRVTITGEHFLPPSAKAAGDSTAQETTSVTDDSLHTDAPEVTLKAEGEPTPTINGLPVSVSFGDQPAPLLSLSNTEVIVEVPEGTTSGRITITVDGQAVTTQTFTLIPAPEITEVTPTAGPVGTEVTISGHYFTAHPDSNRVAFNGIPAAITEADSTSLVATVPEGATTGLIELTTRGQAVTGPTFTVTEAPVPQVNISDISPKQGPVGTEVTITGANFSAIPAENSVTFNGTKATLQSATETELVATVPQGATSGPVKVQADGQTATGPSFSVTADPDKQLAIEDITPKEGPVGTPVIITGANFSSTASENMVTFNGTEASVQAASTTELTVTVPNEATTGAVKVAVGSQTAEGPTFTVTEEPVPQVSISDMSPKTGPVGTEVTIAGQNFSATAADNTVTFNGTDATITSASTTELIVSVPADATTGAVKVVVGSQTAEGPTFTVTETPVPQVTIDDFTPKQGPVGTEVTITGQNFRSTQSENTVTFNGTEASISSASETELVATVPDGTTSGPVKVSVGTQTAMGPSFTVTEDPDKELTIEDITPKEGPVGTEVTISGANFSATAADNTVSFNGTSATVEEASTTELTVAVPDGTTSGPVKVTVGDQSATGPTFTITANEAPAITGEGSFSVEENTTAVATVTATDPDGDDLIFSLSGGTDQGAFSIGEVSGELAFTAAPDFDNPADSDADNTYEVEVQVSDGALSVTKAITVSVTNVNEDPTITGEASFEIEENNTAVGTITADDPDGDALTYSITGGSDQDAFSIGENSGELTFTSAPDFEDPTDANGDNTYEVSMQVADPGGLSHSQNITVAVQGVNDNPPTITSEATFEIEENSTAVGTITAADPDGDALTYSLIGGADQDAFSIGEASGELAFTAAPDFENPTDAGSDNTYEVTVQVSDGARSATQGVSVAVLDVVEAPAFFRGRITTNDGDNYYAYEPGFTFAAVPAGTDLSSVLHFYVSISLSVDPITSASIGGPDADAFSVASIDPDGYTINLSGPTLAYSESPYEFSITAENAEGQTTAQAFTIPVQSPFTGGSGTAADPYKVETVEQLQAVGQYLDAHFVQTVDIDASATSSWNGGKGFKPIADETNTFIGSYDGDGHVITNLTINRTTTKYVGLFGYVGGAGAIKNVHTANGNITGSDIFGSATGGLVGINEGTITGCSTGGTVSASNTNSNVGGLVGISLGAESNSYSTGSIDGAASGGLVGNKSNGTIETSYATGAVSGATHAGGLVGTNRGSSSITRSYATGSVSGSSFVGGLVGSNAGSATVTDSYWDTQTTGQATSDGGTGLNTADMQGTAAETNMGGFEFGSVWQVETDPDNYPTLQQNNPEE